MASLRPSRKAKNKDIRYDSEAIKSSGSEGEVERDNSEEEKAREKTRKRKKDTPKASSRPAKRAKEDTGRKKKVKKDPNAPKKPLSAYMLWLQENRPMIKEEIPGASLGEIGKRAGEMWKALDDKSEWEAKAKQARKNYDRVMQDYKAKQSSAPSKSSPKKAKVKATAKATKGGGVSKGPKGGGKGKKYTSAEYISDEGSSEEQEAPGDGGSSEEESDD